MIARQLVAAYQQRLGATRAAVANSAMRRWDAIPTHDAEAAAEFASAVVPLVVAGQTAAVRATNSYFRLLSLDLTGADPELELDPEDFVGDASRGGTPLLDVYERPFRAFWSALAAGVAIPLALDNGRTRVRQTVETDITVVARNGAGTLVRADGRVVGWRRVTSGGGCDFCEEASRGFYRSEDLMPIHPGCACGVEPVYASDEEPTDTGAAGTHDELGPVDFKTTSPPDQPAPEE